jgi:hypothetical protein
MKPTKAIRLFLFISSIVSSSWLAAQTVTIPFTFSGTSPVAFQMDSYGNLSSLGTFGIGTFSLTGAGTRMFWYSGKAAFRGGHLDNRDAHYWDDSNIGDYSFAFGQDVEATGLASVALGGGGATGSESVTMFGEAEGDHSVALEGGESDGVSSVAIGYAFAEGDYSFAEGVYTFAYGASSIAYGDDVSAIGNSSTAFGFSTLATSYNSFVIGENNVGGGNPTSWVTTDPLFEIGNGTESTTSDALVVYKNGNMQAQGTIRCSPGGDISMGSFTAGTHP